MINCRCCGRPTKEVFSLGDLFVSDFLKPNEQPRTGKHEMKLLLCTYCSFLQLEKSAPPETMWGKYWYRSGINKSMVKELKDVVTSSLECIQMNPGDVFLDIACNDGTLLSFVPHEFDRIGIDPSDDSFKKESSLHGKIVQDYFSADAYKSVTSKKAKIITIIAMFYDLEDPNKFLKDINEIMDDEGLLVLQLSYTPLMVKQLAFDNICHEHIGYHSLGSMTNLLYKNGFKIVDCILNDVNGGSFRIYVRKVNSDDLKFKSSPYRDVASFRIRSLLEYEEGLGIYNENFYQDFYEEMKKLRDETVTFILRERIKGKKIWAYGASTKGNTLLQWYGLDNSVIEYAVERSPYKLGLRTAGTNIPIVSEEDMRKAKPDYLLILPWHFISDFKNRESEYLKNGGKFIVPCPRFEIIGA